ncbi:MAG: carbohydrate porin [bacterium]|nr:carbohydrate porin [bacterium]
MVAIRSRATFGGPLVLLAVLLVGTSVAVGQTQQTTSTTTSEKVLCHSCGVEILGTATGYDDEGHALCSRCAATATVAAEEYKPYDIWTTKRLTGDWGGVRTQMEDVGVKFSPLFVGTYQFNFRGGVNTHNAHESAGKAFYNLEFDFDKMFGLKGATFFARGIQTWNSGVGRHTGAMTPHYWSAGSSGDNEIALDKYWYRQRLFDDRVEFRLGMLLNVADLIDKNVYADNYASKFANRALNHAMNIPTTKGLGAFLRVWPVDWLYAQALVLDPDRDSDFNRRGTGGWESAFHGEDRFRLFWEFGILPSKIPGCEGCPTGHYRFGAWYTPRPKTVFIDNLGGLRATQTRSGDVGFHFNFDQVVWKESDDPKDKQGLGVFGRYAWAHRDVNQIEHFWSLGAVYQGLIPARDADVLGFGMAQSILSSQYRNNVNNDADRETVYELYYAIKVAPWCVVTPDLQLVTNPGGNKDGRDALVGGVRVKIAF